MTHLLISDSSRLGSAISSESNSNMHCDLVVDCKLSPKMAEDQKAPVTPTTLGIQSMNSMN